MASSWRCVVSRTLPRVIALCWAAWCAWTLILYIPPPPPPLSGLAAAPADNLWVVWAVPAALLAAGGLVPPKSPEKHKRLARNLRSAGLVIVSALLVVWALVYMKASDVIYANHLAKNYLALAVGALASSWFIGRETASVTAAQDPHGGDADGIVPGLLDQ